MGDTVMLRCGGHLLTVVGIEDYPEAGVTEGLVCAWFDGRKTVEGIFDPAILATYEALPRRSESGPRASAFSRRRAEPRSAGGVVGLLRRTRGLNQS